MKLLFYWLTAGAFLGYAIVNTDPLSDTHLFLDLVGIVWAVGGPALSAWYTVRKLRAWIRGSRKAWPVN